ncbi:MAG TPA: hypothetical protein VMZ52_10225 [Bryobacteraceae bacterium]|nr:hypothetical protein [Bryobacteraceae bacterium]
MGLVPRLRPVLVLLLFSFGLPAQVIEFESGGLRYQTLTRNGLTVMFAQLPSHVREYSILQVAISNGSKTSCILKPEDFVFYRSDGAVMEAVPARVVVTNMVEKASRHDVIKLVTAYESSIYGNTRMKSTNGYEVRRQNALAEVGSPKIKAAAAASAIAFVNTKLLPGESTDGAVFYRNAGKPLGTGKLVVKTSTVAFEFRMVSSN